MKSFVLGVVLICCFLIGIFIKKYYFLRKEFYKNLNLFVENLINNINYDNKKLNIYVLSEIESSGSTYKKFLELFYAYLNNNTSKKKFYLEFKKTFYFLNTEETNNIVIFLTNIGGKTKEEEIEFLKNNLTRFKEKSNKTYENYNKFANLFLKLFIVLGFIIFIIFF